MNDSTLIAGKTKNVADWKAIREKIRLNPNDMTLWESVYEDFFITRVETRYLKPIASIKKEDTYSGEGFAIMSIYCALIEFLETLWSGKHYVQSKPDVNRNEYNKSGEVFKSFLTNRKPFNSFFDEALAIEFYKDVRCALLHEARTKNSWLIRTDNSKAVEKIGDNWVIDRNQFGRSMDSYLRRFYRAELMTDKDRQDAFIRKFNVLFDLPINF
jgi:hypothetical protein